MVKKDWLYFSAHFAPILMICGYMLNMPYTFLAIFFLSLLVFVVLDLFLPKDESYSYEQVMTTVENDDRITSWGYEIASFSYLLLFLVALGMGVYFAQFKQPFLGWMLYSLIMGYSGSCVLTLCHEYFHRTTQIEKLIGRFFLSLSFSNAYENEHLFNHHDEHIICTEKDCSYAPLNESVYAFIIKYINYATQAAVTVQKRICEKEGFSFFNIFKNTLLKWTLFSFAIPILILIFIGWKGLLFYVIQAYLAIFLNLVESYHQHYGLTRRLDKDGTPEAFTYMNTWACDQLFAGKLHFNVFHHGHHHLFSFCRYPHLKVLRVGPIVPYGLSTVMVISLIPKLWFKIMNPRVEEIFRLRDQFEKEGKL